MIQSDLLTISSLGRGAANDPPPSPPNQHHYRVTFKDSLNEAEPPRSEVFTAPEADAARAIARHRSRFRETVVDVVPLD